MKKLILCFSLLFSLSANAMLTDPNPLCLWQIYTRVERQRAFDKWAHTVFASTSLDGPKRRFLQAYERQLRDLAGTGQISDFDATLNSLTSVTSRETQNRFYFLKGISKWIYIDNAERGQVEVGRVTLLADKEGGFFDSSTGQVFNVSSGGIFGIGSYVKIVAENVPSMFTVFQGADEPTKAFITRYRAEINELYQNGWIINPEILITPNALAEEENITNGETITILFSDNGRDFYFTTNPDSFATALSGWRSKSHRVGFLENLSAAEWQLHAPQSQPKSQILKRRAGG